MFFLFWVGGQGVNLFYQGCLSGGFCKGRFFFVTLVLRGGGFGNGRGDFGGAILAGSIGGGVLEGGFGVAFW